MAISLSVSLETNRTSILVSFCESTTLCRAFLCFHVYIVLSLCALCFLICVYSVMDQFVEEYLQEANKEIERFNSEVDLYAPRDLFD